MIDTAFKRESSLNFGAANRASVRTPSGTSTAFERGATLGVYYQIPVVVSRTIARTTIVISQRTFGHKCERRNIRMHQGATWRRPIALVDYLGNAVDLTGCSLRGNIRKQALDAGTPLIDIACTVEDAALGHVELLVTDTELSGLTTGERLQDTASQHWYDVELEWSDGYVQRIIEGYDEISREVTRTV